MTFCILFSLFYTIPKSYTIRGSWKVPYINLSNPILIVREPNRQYTDKYNGLERIWTTTSEEKFHRKIVVADNDTICYGYNEENYDLQLNDFLPNPNGFSLVGERTYLGKVAYLWRKVDDSNPKIQTYDVYIDKVTGYPLAFYAKAFSLFNSHYDIYILEIEDFIPYALPGYWSFPDICMKPNIPDDPYALSDSLDSIFTNNAERRLNDKSFINKEGRSAFINNLGGRRKSAALDEEEICSKYEYKGTTDFPTNFSWRTNMSYGKPIVGKVRDQVACGSCWAFGAVQALEAQLAMSGISSEFRELSVNQIMDCTWDFGNTGCQGGETGSAFRSLIKSKAKLFLEKDYPYLGVNGYCNRNYTEKAVAMVVDCYAIPRSKNVLKEALMLKGPASIGINVVESMMFYTGGVASDTTCTGTVSDLVHEVLLTGWAVIDGVECWEVKNSWSTHWGHEGYIYIQAEDQEFNCGVTTDAKIPVISTL